jgi:hypothetical protein
MKYLVLCALLTVTVMMMNCHKKDNIPDCGCEGKTYGVLSNEPGIVDSVGDGSIVIFLSNHPYRAVSPCNLPDSIVKLFSTDSLRVLISGELKDICPNSGGRGQPIVISKIELNPD